MKKISLTKLKVGDTCSVDSLLRYGGGYEVDSDDEPGMEKVEKITDNEIIFSDVDDQYCDQKTLYYYDKKASKYYYLERSFTNRWIVFLMEIDDYFEIYMNVIDWFCGDETQTPEHVISIAKDEGVFK